jgi:hypothetical protein
VEGQARVITLAQQAAGISPETVGYIEAHGTGTPLGDPIELAALTQAFRAHTDRKHFCAIGTAKTNVGHLDVAAGVTGLIHAAHIVRDGMFPPTLHYHAPNPKFDLENSPFYVNTKAAEWKAAKTPRRAGVSASNIFAPDSEALLAYEIFLARASRIVRSPKHGRETMLEFKTDWSALAEARERLRESNAPAMVFASPAHSAALDPHGGD